MHWKFWLIAANVVGPFCVAAYLIGSELDDHRPAVPLNGEEKKFLKNLKKVEKMYRKMAGQEDEEDEEEEEELLAEVAEADEAYAGEEVVP